MRKFNNILAVIEPKRDQQLALRRALELAKFNPQAKITALRIIYDYSYDILIMNRNKEKAARSDILETHRVQLESQIDSYLKQIGSSVKVTVKVRFSRDIAEGVLEECRESDYDLLLKGANKHGVLDSIIFTPIDWYLLRNSDIPVVICKDHPWRKAGNIVLAIDFISQASKRNNVQMLRAAQMVSTVTGGKIHLVNCAPIYLPSIMLEVPHYSPEIYEENILKEHQRLMQEFAQTHNIDKNNCHIGEGMPDSVIPKLCKKLDADVVFIGSASRTGLRAALIGNTCEEIVDDLDADLVVLNNKTLKNESY